MISRLVYIILRIYFLNLGGKNTSSALKVHLGVLWPFFVISSNKWRLARARGRPTATLQAMQIRLESADVTFALKLGLSNEHIQDGRTVTRPNK